MIAVRLRPLEVRLDRLPRNVRLDRPPHGHLMRTTQD